MDNKFKVAFNGRTLCVFAVINSSDLGSIVTHIANIDTMSRRIYTTADGYNLLATDEFKSTHEVLKFEDAGLRKFNVCTNFYISELSSIIKMCSREFVF